MGKDDQDNNTAGMERDIVFQSQQKQAQANDSFYAMMQETKKQVKNDIVEYLCNQSWGIRKAKVKLTLPNGKSTYTIKEIEGWYPTIENTHPLMNLADAIQVAEFVSGQAAESFSLTVYQTGVNTLYIAAHLAIISMQMLDNVRYDFKGNENDAAAFGVKCVSIYHSILNRSLSGYMIQQMASTTTNLNRTERREGETMRIEKESSLNKMLGIGRKSQ